MSQFELKDFFQYLANEEFRPALIIAAIAIFLIVLLIIYLLLRKKGKGATVANEILVDSPKAPAKEIRVDSPKLPAAKPSRHSIPQDSVLRRHYVSHIKYMIETVTFPRPTDSILRRHYDHLIASELEACLDDETHMDRLISRYEEHRRSASR